MQCENTIDDEQIGRLYPLCYARNPGVRGEVILWSLYGSATGKLGDMVDQQIGFDQIGVVEVQAGAFFVAEGAEIAVVVVEVEMRAFELARHFLRQRRFARARTPG